MLDINWTRPAVANDPRSNPAEAAAELRAAGAIVNDLLHLVRQPSVTPADVLSRIESVQGRDWKSASRDLRNALHPDRHLGADRIQLNFLHRAVDLIQASHRCANGDDGGKKEFDDAVKHFKELSAKLESYTRDGLTPFHALFIPSAALFEPYPGMTNECLYSVPHQTVEEVGRLVRTAEVAAHVERPNDPTLSASYETACAKITGALGQLFNFSSLDQWSRHFGREYSVTVKDAPALEALRSGVATLLMCGGHDPEKFVVG